MEGDTRFTAADHQWMAQAHRLAEKGLFTTDPNPRVGCLLVKQGERVGKGYHIEVGGPHAEIHALQDAGEAAAGATAYVTLEPCSHYGKTPPCSDALIAAGVARVVIALEDPNPAVSGNGIRRLRAAGIAVESGLMPQETERLNPGFLMRMRQQRPYVRVKMAQSLDGRTAMASGESQWITGAAARRDVQRLRARSSAILTAVGTVLADDPSLNVRELEVPHRQPLRIVLDPAADTPADARLFTISTPILMVIAQQTAVPPGWSAHRQVDVLQLPGTGGRIDLSQLMQALGRMELNELHVEAGATLAGALISEGLVDELVIYTAPLLMGSEGRPLFRLPLAEMSQKIVLTIVERRQLGRDERIVARLDRGG
jgi:diaminohydroxyphosphoribosylaminopyrimidine deaminase/5-amino-6-(5-phosphoribosylamino)uracil reductase